MSANPPNQGQVTSAGPSTLTDGNQSWENNVWQNYVVYIVAGRGAGQSALITSNTSSVLTISGTWVTEPDHSSSYTINLPKSSPPYNFIEGKNALSCSGITEIPVTASKMPFDGKVHLDIYSSAGNIELDVYFSARTQFGVLAAGYNHFEFSLAANADIAVYIVGTTTVSYSIGVGQA